MFSSQAQLTQTQGLWNVELIAPGTLETLNWLHGDRLLGEPVLIYPSDSFADVKKLQLPCIDIHHAEPTLTIF